MRRVKSETLVLILGIIFIVGGLLWFYYLSNIYPLLVPPHGGSETFEISDGNYTLPWQPLSKCRVWVIAEKPVAVYLDGRFIDQGEKVMVVLTPGPHNVTVTSQEPVSGRMVARQEPPPTDFIMASALILVGLLIIAYPRIFKRKGALKTPIQPIL